MRTILFFDLPIKTKVQIRSYSKFVKFIKKQGFVMMQESVYIKLSINQTIVDHVMSQIRKEVPSDGIISVLTITENQFNSIEHVIGEFTTDVIISDERVIQL